MSSIAIAEVPLSISFLSRVDGADGSQRNGQISQAEINEFNKRSLAESDRQNLATLQALLNVQRQKNASSAPAARPNTEPKGFLDTVGDFFGDALKFLGDLGENRIVQGALGVASLVGWFVPVAGAIIGGVGLVLSLSSILSRLVDDKREVNWWMLIPTLLYGAQILTPESVWGAVGGISAYYIIGFDSQMQRIKGALENLNPLPKT